MSSEGKHEQKKASPVSVTAQTEERGNEKQERKRSSDTDEQDDDKKRARLLDQGQRDMAQVLGLKAGDRLEVKWDISDGQSEQVQTRWWGATLLDHDGRTSDDGVAIRVLDYDPYPEGGFPERSLEDVVFVNECALLNSDAEELLYRKEGEEETVALGEEELRDELNEMLAGILSKHSSRFQSLDPAKQAHLAEMIADGKESIISTIMKRWENSHKVISAADVPSILEEAFSQFRENP
jgi:hypothetical protein